MLPTIWFRNTQSWSGHHDRLELHAARGEKDAVIQMNDPSYGKRWLVCEGSPGLLFTENETNNKWFFGVENASRYVKDAINNYIVQGDGEAVNPEPVKTKAAAHYRLEIAAGQSGTIRLRL